MNRVESDELNLAELIQSEGCDSLEALIEDFGTESSVPGICINPDCDYTEYTEPDQDAGRCEACGTLTIKSFLILAGLI